MFSNIFFSKNTWKLRQNRQFEAKTVKHDSWSIRKYETDVRQNLTQCQEHIKLSLPVEYGDVTINPTWRTGRTPYWKSFLAITRLHIVWLRRNLELSWVEGLTSLWKFGVRRHNRTHTRVWWRCPISKIQHDGRPPFWKWLYLHISISISTSQPRIVWIWRNLICRQILTKAMETWQKFRNLQLQNGGRTPYWKSF